MRMIGIVYHGNVDTLIFLLFSKNIRLLDSDISGHFIIKHDHDNNLFVIVTI